MAVRIVTVAVEQTAYHFDRPYTYFIPDSAVGCSLPGCRAVVPFGRGNTRRNAVILTCGEGFPEAGTKPVDSLPDEEPLITDEFLKLAGWLKDHTFCTLYEALRLALPAGINFKMTVCYRAETLPDGVQSLPAEWQPLYQAVAGQNEPAERDRLLSLFGQESASLLDRMCKKGVLVRCDRSQRRMKDATVRTVRLCPQADLSALTPKQKEIVSLLQEVGAASVKEITYFTGIGAGVIHTLEKNEIVELFDTEVYRSDTVSEPTDHAEIVLNEEQQGVFEDLLCALHEKRPKPALLYGVTGSGKTQIYLKLIDAAVAAGKSAIVMVPEISLTPQTLAIFRARYGKRVAVFHSRLSMGERMDEWKRVRRGEADIAVGTRSAVFAPVKNPALIVMDEEQEHTYKSEASPRFHARDVARFRAAYSGGLLLLASATPSVETFALAQKGIYSLHRLSARYGGARLPKVIVANLCDDLSRGTVSVIGTQLRNCLEDTLAAHKQAILLLNRRGYHTFISCRSCGHVIMCRNCSISMAYHRANRRLMCHYCGSSTELPDKCPECGGEFLKLTGAGTQKAEEELQILFPQARIVRMDADSTMAKGSHEDKLSRFGAGEYDILLGTQMVAKGLDFPGVTLVGILSADSTLYSSDYKSAERAFSLFTQVIGRAGRGNDSGIAVIQTVAPDDELLSLAEQQDYDCFYKREIGIRKMMQYPPFCDLCLVGFTGQDESETASAAGDFLQLIRKRISEDYPSLSVRVLGPSPAQIVRVGGQFRHRLILKCRDSAPLREMLSSVLVAFSQDGAHKAVSVWADMNPDGIL